jgi:hypothetical protein
LKRKSAILFILALSVLTAAAPAQVKQSKKPLIGVATIKNSTTEALSVHMLRLVLVQELNNKITEAVELFGTSTDETTADAKKKQCDFILYNDIVFAVRADRGSRSAPGGRDSDPYAPAGQFVVRIRFKLVAPGVAKPRMEDTTASSNSSSVTAQEAAEGALRAVRQFVVSELRTKK